MAGASGHPPAEGARGLVLPQQLSPHHRPAPSQRGLATSHRQRLAWRYVRRLGRLVQATIAPSRAVVRELESAGVDNVVHVPLGVELDRFTPTRRARAEETRRRFGLPEGPLAIYVGRMAAEKDIDLLLEGWLEVERRTGARLVLVGAGPALRWLRRTRGGKRATWLPYQRDRDLLADLYAAMDLYVAPGSAETFGLSAMEAMASGLPVLSVDRGGVSEAVSLSGAGRSTPPATPGTSPAGHRSLRSGSSRPRSPGSALCRGAPRLGRGARAAVRRLPTGVRCHPERSEGSVTCGCPLHCVQGDKVHSSTPLSSASPSFSAISWSAPWRIQWIVRGLGHRSGSGTRSS